jgi:C4-dicarboxylate transporter DctM subunit
MQVILLVGIFSGVFTATEARGRFGGVRHRRRGAGVPRARLARGVRHRQDSAVSTGVIFILLAMGALLAYLHHAVRPRPRR